ncbi:hypothetical protein SAMN04487950_0934 [Halogranum rubrum]|uniref:Uncharacterized protein n=1 Tax=Halogranum rubrum TaxID=553466 RepID=A0A1I4C5M0_9EURY|nr:hypothetical protein SAMN04487950_0934 [Halogranum rubrum]
MTQSEGGGTVYRCSDGRYYGDVDVWYHLESEAWTPCCWNSDSMTEWVETQEGELLVLVPIIHSSLPEQVQIEHTAAGTSVL